MGLPPDSPLALDFDIACTFLGVKSEAEAVESGSGKKKPRDIASLPPGNVSF